MQGEQQAVKKQRVIQLGSNPLKSTITSKEQNVFKTENGSFQKKVTYVRYNQPPSGVSGNAYFQNYQFNPNETNEKSVYQSS